MTSETQPKSRTYVKTWFFIEPSLLIYLTILTSALCLSVILASALTLTFFIFFRGFDYFVFLKIPLSPISLFEKLLFRMGKIFNFEKSF